MLTTVGQFNKMIMSTKWAMGALNTYLTMMASFMNKTGVEPDSLSFIHISLHLHTMMKAATDIKYQINPWIYAILSHY